MGKIHQENRKHENDEWKMSNLIEKRRRDIKLQKKYNKVKKRMRKINELTLCKKSRRIEESCEIRRA